MNEAEERALLFSGQFSESSLRSKDLETQIEEERKTVSTLKEQLAALEATHDVQVQKLKSADLATQKALAEKKQLQSEL